MPDWSPRRRLVTRIRRPPGWCGRGRHVGDQAVEGACGGGGCSAGVGFEHSPAGDLPFRPRTRDYALLLATFQFVAARFLNIPKRSLNLKKTDSAFGAPVERRSTSTM